MRQDCTVAKYEGDFMQPYFIVERFTTSDGVRTRICDGQYRTKKEATEACEWKNRP